MAPRVPPKLRTYANEYRSHDLQRREKGQLSKIQLPNFPSAKCRLAPLPDGQAETVEDVLPPSSSRSDMNGEASPPSQLLNGSADPHSMH
jgi:hypothetical protein